MKRLLVRLLLVMIISVCAFKGFAQKPINWTSKQLVEPAALAETIKAGKNIPLLVSVGPGATIPNSIDIGMVNNEEGMDKLKASLSKIEKGKKVIVYCGCCPFEHCPNVRPTIDLLKEMKFANYYLLNIPTNIKKDWIDKGYPVVKS